MKIQTWLRRTAGYGTSYSLALRDMLVKAASRIDDLESELRRCTCADVNQSIADAGELDSHKEPR